MADDRELEQERFAELRRTNDPALRDRLIEDHLWLARHCARRFSGRGESPDDLNQVANMALVKAVDRFDHTFKVRFATFAVPTIVGELRRHFRDRTWSMRVSRRLKDLHLELKAASEQLSHDLGRSPTVDELADSLDCTPEEVLEALEAGAAYRATSLTAGLGAEEGEEIVPGEPDEELEDTTVRVLVQSALNTLPERERRVVYLRFYLGLTQSEIAEEIGVSQVHVSRILRATLSQLGDELGEGAAELLEPRVTPRYPHLARTDPLQTESQMPSPEGFAVEVSPPEDATVRIQVRGELDMSAAPGLTEAVGQAASAGTTVVLDLSKVTFLDSSAIGALVACGREIGEGGGRLQIGPRSDVVGRVLEITGLAEGSEAFDVLAGDG